MGEVIQFIPKSALERARLIREARAIREHIPDGERPRQPAARLLKAGHGAEALEK
jgi:hypothetical protein